MRSTAFTSYAMFALALTSMSVFAKAQTRPIDTFGLAQAIPFAETITPDELRAHAYILASDSLQGRETGTEGMTLAARYLGQQFAELGLPRIGEDYSYSQAIAFERASWDRVRMSVNSEAYRHLRSFYAFPAEAEAMTVTTDDVVFLGYGIDADSYSDYADAGDLTGRIGIVLAGEPFSRKGVSQVTGTADTSEWSRQLSLKQAAAAAAGLQALLVVEPNIQAGIAANRARIVDNSMRVAKTGQSASAKTVTTLHVSPKVLRELADDERKAVVKARKRMAKRGRSRAVELPGTLSLELEPRVTKLRGENILGYFRGADPEVADEVIVISAHYDHLGKRADAVFNGADDNASGTSTVLEIADAFQQAYKAGIAPRRSVLCLLVSGEEKGLLGSEFYAANPVFPLENTIADINIDMIGRYDEAHSDSSAYIYVIGAGRISPDLDAVTRAMSAEYSGLALDYTFDAPDDPNRFYYRSDHYNFAKNGIPSVFFFSGVHEDYHQPTDTPDKLDYEKMATVGKQAFVTAWNLANREGELNRKAGE